MNVRYLITVVCLSTACGGVVDDAKETANSAKEKVGEGANNTKDKISDSAVCKGLIRDSISTRIENVITDQIGGDAPIALSDITSIAKAYALTLDSTSLLAGNLIGIAAATSSLEGCDATSDCADPVLGESVGSISKTCEGEVETFSFDDGCQLYATPISGAVSIDGPTWVFDQFQVVDERYLDGGVVVENVSVERFAVDSVNESGFEMVRNRGKSCEDLMRFRTLDVEKTSAYLVTTDFDRETDAGTDYTVKTQTLSWPTDRSCTCPTAGTASLLLSAFQDKTVPLSLEMAFEEAGDCGEPTVTIPEVSAFCDDYGCDGDLLGESLTALFRGFCSI